MSTLYYLQRCSQYEQKNQSSKQEPCTISGRTCSRAKEVYNPIPCYKRQGTLDANVNQLPAVTFTGVSLSHFPGAALLSRHSNWGSRHNTARFFLSLFLLHTADKILCSEEYKSLRLFIVVYTLVVFMSCCRNYMYASFHCYNC